MPRKALTVKKKAQISSEEKSKLYARAVVLYEAEQKRIADGRAALPEVEKILSIDEIQVSLRLSGLAPADDRRRPSHSYLRKWLITTLQRVWTAIR